MTERDDDFERRYDAFRTWLVVRMIRGNSTETIEDYGDPEMVDEWHRRHIESVRKFEEKIGMPALEWLKIQHEASDAFRAADKERRKRERRREILLWLVEVPLIAVFSACIANLLT